MFKLLLLVPLLLLAGGNSSFAEIVPPIQRAVLRINGKDHPLRASSTIIPYAQRLFTSSSVDNSPEHGSKREWDAANGSPDFILVHYDPALVVTLAGRDRHFTEVLIPLPRGKWPSHFFARFDDEVYAFSKYLPQRLADVVCSSEIGFKDVSPYSILCQNWTPSPL
jgi:hypothetical protein